MTRDEVKELFKLLIWAYPSILELTSDKIDFWHELLKDIDYLKAMKAVKEHVKTNKFPPTIAEIREAVKADYKPTHGYEDTEIYRDFLEITGGEKE